MKVRVISMESSVERRRVFQELNGHIDFSFFDAIVGAELTKEYIASTKLFEDNLPYTAGAYGVALSHLALWNEAIESNEVITVAEDDAIFRLDFESVASNILASFPLAWDIILWGWNFDSILSLNAMPNISPAVMLFNQDQLRSSVDAFQKLSDVTSLLRLDKCFGIPAYSISPAGAAKFKSHCFPLSNFKLFFPVLNREMPNNGIDIAMNRIYQASNSFVSFPPLAITRNDHAISTIQNGSYVSK